MAKFKKAVREGLWLKVLIGGSSGSGKTFSALRLATGIANKTGGRIAAIDTENGRMRINADQFDFDDVQLNDPYTPEKYIEQIDEAIASGYKILVIDSMAHEWDYILGLHSKMPGNSYTNWSKLTPRHNTFTEKILQSPLHIIATVRGKDEYVLESNDKGKQVPKKIGIGFTQRGNIEYDYMTTFNLDQKSHIAEVMKDNTHLFEGRYDLLTEKDGERLYEWANAGGSPKKKVEKTVIAGEQTLENIIEEIKNKTVSLVGAGFDKKIISDAIKSEFTTANYNQIKDIVVAKKVLEALNNIE